jgi:hypothetical protein
MKPDMHKWELAQIFSNFLTKKIIVDTALSFSQVDLPYPVWNWDKTGEVARKMTIAQSLKKFKYVRRISHTKM